MRPSTSVKAITLHLRCRGNNEEKEMTNRNVSNTLLAGMTLVFLAGCGPFVDAGQFRTEKKLSRAAMNLSREAYKNCLRQHLYDTSPCRGFKEIHEADLKAHSAILGGGGKIKVKVE